MFDHNIQDLAEAYRAKHQLKPKDPIDILKDNAEALYHAKWRDTKHFSPEFYILEANELDIKRKIINKILKKAVFIGEAELIVHCCEGDYGLYIDDPDFTEEMLNFVSGQKIKIKLEIIREE